MVLVDEDSDFVFFDLVNEAVFGIDSVGPAAGEARSPQSMFSCQSAHREKSSSGREKAHRNTSGPVLRLRDGAPLQLAQILRAQNRKIPYAGIYWVGQIDNEF